MTNDLATLVGSRICHDLISPIGAIGNGVELMALTGGGDTSAEMALIAQSAQNASARIRFFRVAFGAAPPGQSLPRREVLGILSDIAQGGRTSFDWTVEGEISRAEVRSCFLVLMCCETAMIQGGTVAISRNGAHWTISAEADRLRLDDALWDALAGDGMTDLPTPAQVQFALLPQVLRDTGCSLTVTRSDTALTVTFGPN